MTAQKITLWGNGSLRVLRVHWALLELGLDYRHEPIQARSGETQTAAYTAINPKQKIPFLQDGNLAISESAAIVQYLFRQYGDGDAVYLPKTPAEEALSDEWCFFVMTEFDAHTLYVMRRHQYLSDIYGEAPDAVASAGEYFQKQMLASAGKVALADPYLFGDKIGVADILLTSCIEWALRYGQDLDTRYLEYFARTRIRPAYVDALSRNKVS